MNNLTALAAEYGANGTAGEPIQHALLAKALARRGYSVSMVIADYGQPDGATWHDVRTFKAFDKKAGLPLLRFIHPRWTGLWSALKRAEADVYYTSCAGGIVGQIALFCERHDRRFIFRVASDADCARDTLLIQSCYWRDARLYEYGLRRASGVLAQSMRQQQLLERNFGVRSSLAGMLVEPAVARPELRERDIDVLWVSNIRGVKRPDVLLEVADRLPELGLHMVGGTVPGEVQCFESTRAQAAKRDNVKFHGAVPYRDAGALYARARVFVNTSDVEGFPNTYLQAWMSGTPIVAFFDPDDVIARHGLGVVVRSAQQMAEAIRSLVRDERAWQAARDRCISFIEREFGEDRILESYLRLIEAR